MNNSPPGTPRLKYRENGLSLDESASTQATASDSVDGVVDPRSQAPYQRQGSQLEHETTNFCAGIPRPVRSSSTYYSAAEPLNVVENDYSSIPNYKEFQATFRDLFQEREGTIGDDSWDGSQGGDSSTATDNRGLLRTVRTDVKRGVVYLWGLTRKSISELRESDDKYCCGRLTKMWTSIPFVKTMQSYKKKYFLKDCSAGITEGIMNIPLGMSYAGLSNLPAVYGLYTGFIPPLIYMFFGTCHQIGFGVSAIESLLLGESVESVIGYIGNQPNGDDVTQEDIERKVAVTIFMSLLIGIWLTILGVLKLGVISALLSDPILSAFITASAFLIAASQLKHLLETCFSRVPTTENTYNFDSPQGIPLSGMMAPKVWVDAFRALPDWNWIALIMGCSGIAFLYIMKKMNSAFLPRIPLPNQLFLVIISTAVTYAFGLNESPYDLNILGHIQSGLPSFKVPSFPLGEESFSSLFGSALLQSLIAAIVYYIITVSIGKTFSARNNYSIDSNQELLAMGSANIIGPFFQAFGSTASLSRTSVIDNIGAKTVLHAAYAVVVMGLVLLALTSTLYYLPTTTLASIVMFGVYRMIDFSELSSLYYVSKSDALLWVVAFTVTLLGGAIYGIAVGVLISLLWIVAKSSWPKAVVLACLPQSNVFRNIKRFPMAREIPGIRIFRFDGNLHFANKDYFSRRVKKLDATPTEDGTPIHTVIIDASSINQVDISATRTLITLAEEFSAKNVRLIFANWKGPQRDFLKGVGFYNSFPPENMFLSLHDAVAFAMAAEPRNSDETALSEDGGDLEFGKSDSRELQRRIEAGLGDKSPSLVEIDPSGEEHLWTNVAPTRAKSVGSL